MLCGVSGRKKTANVGENTAVKCTLISQSSFTSLVERVNVHCPSSFNGLFTKQVSYTVGTLRNVFDQETLQIIH